MIDGQHMGRWVQKQRLRIKKGNLRQDRVDRLRALPGWVDGTTA
ncbi:MAG: helicase associated domain-containing protein [Candidatus Dormibacteria bacterium]